MSESAAEFPPEGAQAGGGEQDAMAAEWEAALAQQSSSGGASADAMFDVNYQVTRRKRGHFGQKRVGAFL